MKAYMAILRDASGHYETIINLQHLAPVLITHPTRRYRVVHMALDKPIAVYDRMDYVPTADDVWLEQFA